MLQPNENLVNRGVDDFLDEGYSPPEKPSYLSRHGDVEETLDERLAAGGAGGVGGAGHQRDRERRRGR